MTTIVLIYVLIPLVLLGIAAGISWAMMREYRHTLNIIERVRGREMRMHIDGDVAIPVEKERGVNVIKVREKSVWSPELQAQIDKTDKMGRDLQELVKMTREKWEMERLRESDRNLAERAEALRNKNRKPQPVMSSIGRGNDRPVRTKAEVLIPYELSEMDKDILEEFYNR